MFDISSFSFHSLITPDIFKISAFRRTIVLKIYKSHLRWRHVSCQFFLEQTSKQTRTSDFKVVKILLALPNSLLWRIHENSLLKQDTDLNACQSQTVGSPSHDRLPKKNFPIPILFPHNLPSWRSNIPSLLFVSLGRRDAKKKKKNWITSFLPRLQATSMQQVTECGSFNFFKS